MQHFFPKKNSQVFIMLVCIQPQQPSTSKLNALELKERMQKNKCLLRLFNNSLKPNLMLKKR